MSKRISDSMKLQLFCTVLVSVAVAVVVFMSAFLMSNEVLDRAVYGTILSDKIVIHHFWVATLCGLVAFVAFSFCFIFMINRKVSYISLLKEELDILSGGQLEYPVTIIGSDELSELAAGIDQMRRSIIKHQEVENQMQSANSELITAMSHDLRTPLTSLLVYLEILERKKYADEEQMQNLIHKSVAQTMRIKCMADKLFEYFLSYATEWEDADMEIIDADQLFQQILGDYACALESNGMLVDTDFSQISAGVNVNTELLQRALDNLYSNLMKYADPQEKILLSYQRKEQGIQISISNKIRKKKEKIESTSIGLITCRRIIEYHKGQFSVVKNDSDFCVMISLPVQE